MIVFCFSRTTQGHWFYHRYNFEYNFILWFRKTAGNFMISRMNRNKTYKCSLSATRRDFEKVEEVSQKEKGYWKPSDYKIIGKGTWGKFYDDKSSTSISDYIQYYPVQLCRIPKLFQLMPTYFLQFHLTCRNQIISERKAEKIQFLDRKVINTQYLYHIYRWNYRACIILRSVLRHCGWEKRLKRISSCVI